jgi:hypothetical protein
LFIRSSNIDSVNEVVNEVELQWGKLKILQGRVFADGKDYYVNSDEVDVVAYHPEHGILMLTPGTYRIERVQYLQAGHD